MARDLDLRERGGLEQERGRVGVLFLDNGKSGYLAEGRKKQ